MADHPRPPYSICERCPHDTRLCLADYWRSVACGREHVELRFTCPFIEIGFTTEIAGLAPWRLTDLGYSAAGHARGTVAIADTHASPPGETLREIARMFHSRGWFRTVEPTTIAAALESAYRAHVSVDLETSQPRQRLAA